jgi:formylglycine-generating enzyme required for sulfatase activity
MRAWLPLIIMLAGCSNGTAELRTTCRGAAPPLAPGDRSAMIWVPAGDTLLGSDRFHPEERPKRRAHVGGFWIDPHEVTNAEFAAFVAATGYRTTAERTGGGAVFHSPLDAAGPDDITRWWRPDSTASWRTPRGAGGRPSLPEEPVLQVTQEDALAYAKWRGRDLPTEAEWERAARGGLSDAEYSWGDEAAKASRANHWQGMFPIRDTGADGYHGVAPVGCYEPNGYGVHDMAGNVWELTKGAWDRPGASEGAIVIKGGSWLCADDYCLRYRPAARQPGDPSLGTDHIGFRTVLRGLGTDVTPGHP